MLYIDTCSFEDYDKVVCFLLERNVPIVRRSKLKMVVVAEMAYELANQMRDEVDFDEEISIGENPID